MELKFDNDKFKEQECKASCIVYVDDIDSSIYEREFTYEKALEKVKDRLEQLISESEYIINQIDFELKLRRN